MVRRDEGEDGRGRQQQEIQRRQQLKRRHLVSPMQRSLFSTSM